MFGEIGLGLGAVSSLWDLVNKDKDTAAAQGGGEFAALMNLQTGLGASSAFTTAGDRMNVADSMRAGTEEAQQMLREMTENGIEGAMRWAMKKLREKIMEEMGVSEASLAAMDPAQRQAIEAKIAEEVEKRVKEAMGVTPDGAMDEAKMAEFKAKLMEAAKAYRSDTPVV